MNRKLLVALVVVQLAIPGLAIAIEHSVSGHVNRLIRFGDDGKASDIQHLDNASSQSRIRWRGTGDIGRGMKAGIYVESGISSSRSSVVGLKASQDGGANADSVFSIRHSTLSFSGKWGLLRIGHTSAASDGSAQADLSGDTLINWSEGAPDLAPPDLAVERRALVLEREEDVPGSDLLRSTHLPLDRDATEPSERSVDAHRELRDGFDARPVLRNGLLGGLFVRLFRGFRGTP